MKAIRYQGIYTKGTSTAYGSDVINIMSTNDNNSYSSYISMNDNVIEENSSDNGFIIVVFNDDLTVRRNRFLEVKTTTQSNNIVSFINSVINTNRDLLIAMASVGNIERDDESILNDFFNNKGSILWSKRQLFSEQDDNGVILKDRIPYCCLLSTDLGIVYEKYGNYQINDEDDNAILNVPYHNFDSFGMNGYGLNLIDIEEYNNSNSSSTSETYSISSIEPTQNVRLTANARIENLDQYPSNNARLVIQENGTNIETVTIDSNVWQEIDTFIPMSESNDYDLIIEKDSDISLDISNIQIVKAGFSTVNTDVKFKFNKANENLSCFGLYESHNNMRISYEDDYDNAYSDGVKPFTMDATTFLYRSQKDSITITTSLESDFIEIDPRIDYVFSTWFKGLTNNDQIDIVCSFYDSSQQLINVEYFDKQYSNTITIDSYNIDSAQYGFCQSFILSTTSTRFDLKRFNDVEFNLLNEDGFGLEQTNKTVPKLNNDISYIKLQINASNVEMIMPFISELKFGFKNDGTILGPLIEDSLV